MTRILSGTFWVLVYLILTLSPLFVLLIGPGLSGRTFWRELSVALGFAGLGMAGLQFLLTARFKRITYPFGIDIVYYFHRQISIVALVLILAHPVILFASEPRMLSLLNPAIAPWSIQAGMIALLALLILIASSLWRSTLRIPYELWRVMHGILAVTVVSLGVVHINAIAYYTHLPWKHTLWVLLGTSWIGALLYVRIVKPLKMLRRPYRVEQVVQERGNSWTLIIKPEGHKGLEFQPGQFAWLTIQSSPFAMREHPFSFSSSAMHPERFHFTIKALGDFTSRIKEVTPGARAYLDGPYGSFSIDACTAPGYIFIAGGTGIVPIMSMLRTMADRRDRRPVLLVFANKTWEGVAFREELEELNERLRLDVVNVLETPPEGWEGETGFVTPELLARHLPEDRMNRAYFICGPVPMRHAVERALRRLGIPFEKFQAERFNWV